jgi:CelD/BcsL family acetyltransferase involved in cellulose biosynthesis
MMSSFDIRIFHHLDEVAPVWRRAEAVADLFVYQRFDWLEDWFRLVGAAAGVQPCIVLVNDEHRQPLMLLPLAIERRLLGKALVWLGAEFFDYHAPVLMPGALGKLDDIGIERIWRAIAATLRGADYADFARQPAAIGGQANPLIKLRALPYMERAHHTELTDGWSAYYTSKRGRRTRHNDRRKRKKLEKEGQLDFIVADKAEDIDRLISAMVRQKRAYARAIGKTNLLEQAGYEAFLREKALQGLDDGSIVVCGLSLNGAILAAQWGAVHRRRLYSVVASYDDGPFSKLSPGEFLLHDLMSWCFDENIDVFDFTYGDEPYKRAWCEHQTPLYRSLLPLSAWGWLLTSATRCILHGREEAKRATWLRKANAHLQTLRTRLQTS